MKRTILLAVACVAVMFTVGQVQAGTIVFEINALTVDIGGSGSTDYTIAINPFIAINPLFETDQIQPNDPDAKFMSSDIGGSFDTRSWRSTEIGRISGAASTGTYFDLNVPVFNNSGSILTSAGWVAGSDNYMGISFKDANINSDALTFGWMQIRVGGNDDLELLRVVYDDMGGDLTLGAALDAIGSGNPNITTTPEPTSLAIFGIGALCMSAGAARRRRKEKQAAAA